MVNNLLKQDGATTFTHVVALGIGLFGLIIRVPFLYSNLTGDEARSAITPLKTIVTTYIGHTNHIFHEVLTWGVRQLLGRNFITIRLVSLIAGITSLWCLYYLASKLVNPLTGLLASGLLATSYQHIEYSIRSEGYALYVFFTIVALVLANLFHERRQSRRWIVLSFIVVLSLGLYTIPIMLYPAGVCFLWIILRSEFWRSNRPFNNIQWSAIIAVGTTMMTLLLFSPVFYVQGMDFIVDNPMIQPSDSMGWWAKFRTTFRGLFLIWTGNGSIMLSVVFLFGLGGAVCLRQLQALQKLFLSAVLFPLVMLIVYPAFMPTRGWIFLLPIFYLVVSAGVVNILEWFRIYHFTVLLAFLVFVISLNGIGQFGQLRSLYQQPGIEQVRELIGQLNRENIAQYNVIFPYKGHHMAYIKRHPALDQRRVRDSFDPSNDYVIVYKTKRAWRSVQRLLNVHDQLIDSRDILFRNELGTVVLLTTGDEPDRDDVPFSW